jgi:hypothetical protein
MSAMLWVATVASVVVTAAVLVVALATRSRDDLGSVSAHWLITENRIDKP